MKTKLSGNEAVATAMRQINPDVVAAFPITPSTEVPQYFSSFVNNGKVTTEFIPVESEHSAMSACIGASAAGARAMTATSSNGMSLMWEMLYIAAGARLPIVLNLINRAVSAPLNIHNDHSDSMGARDAGWIQLYAESNQEAYDNMLMCNRIAEDPSVMLPIMNCQDGFITSHGIEAIDLVDDEDVKKFVGEYNPESYLLKDGEPMASGPLSLPTHTFEQKRSQAEAMKRAAKVIEKVTKEFGDMTGRYYGNIECYNMGDAERAVVLINSTAGTAKYVCDRLREKGEKVGVVKIRVFRPFPLDDIVTALRTCKAVAVLDKTDSCNGAGGPLFTEVRSALYNEIVKPDIVNYIYGIGGRDVKTSDIEKVFEDLKDVAGGNLGETYRYLGCY
ncbi:MAG: pyruvate ferredoxin oxidoreductase [Clostridia bacterium]|nr:pyruvate ferredoxin oxidoreductase [Clostridia bacterium]